MRKSTFCSFLKLHTELQVEIYPMRIHLSEAMYRMMWSYFFPEEEQHSQKRQVWQIPVFSNTFDSDFFLNCWTKYSLSSLKYLKDVWKVSTIVGTKRVKKTISLPETSETSTKSTREFDASGKASALTAASITADPSARGESSRVSSTAKKNFLFSEISCLKLLDVLTRL